MCVYRLNRRKTSSLYYIYGRGQRDLQLWPLPMKLHTGDQVNVPALSRPGAHLRRSWGDIKYILSLLFYTVIVYCDLYIYIVY